MLLLISSIQKNSGNAKATGKPFEMYRATVLMPFQNIASTNFNTDGIGCNAIELEVSNAAYSGFRQLFASKFKGGPVQIDCETSIGRGGVNIITGFKQPAVV